MKTSKSNTSFITNDSFLLSQNYEKHRSAILQTSSRKPMQTQVPKTHTQRLYFYRGQCLCLQNERV